jgi:hypothetical protein
MIAAGCGYSSGLRIPEEEGDRVGIEFFENRTPEPDLEREFHGALSRAVIDLIDADVAAPDRSNLVVRGEILRFQRRSGIRSTDNELLESGIQIQVRCGLWRRRRPGEAVPAPPPERRQRTRESIGYDHRRGITYERDFSKQPALGTTYDPDWIQIGSAVADMAVGYIIGESGNEAEARARALRNVAEGLVLDLFEPMN